MNKPALCRTRPRKPSDCVMQSPTRKHHPGPLSTRLSTSYPQPDGTVAPHPALTPLPLKQSPPCSREPPPSPLCPRSFPHQAKTSMHTPTTPRPPYAPHSGSPEPRLLVEGAWSFCRFHNFRCRLRCFCPGRQRGAREGRGGREERGGVSETKATLRYHSITVYDSILSTVLHSTISPCSSPSTGHCCKWLCNSPKNRIHNAPSRNSVTNNSMAAVHIAKKEQRTIRLRAQKKKSRHSR